MLRKWLLLWWLLATAVFQFVIGMAARILDLSYWQALGLTLLANLAAAGFILLIKYVALAPLRRQIESVVQSRGALVAPVLLDSATAPVGSRSETSSAVTGLLIGTREGLEVRQSDGAPQLIVPWSSVSDIRLGSSGLRTYNVTVEISTRSRRQEWWLVPLNEVGFARRSGRVFELIERLLALRDSSLAAMPTTT